MWFHPRSQLPEPIPEQALDSSLPKPDGRARARGLLVRTTFGVLIAKGFTKIVPLFLPEPRITTVKLRDKANPCRRARHSLAVAKISPS
jgi:hypothetical protein